MLKGKAAGEKARLSIHAVKSVFKIASGLERIPSIRGIQNHLK